ncbi:MAG: N-carbamoylputrescine amidase, partial [Cyclobacteriaceae bacterium]
MSTEQVLKVGIVQQINSDDIKANISKLEANIRECASQGAQLVVLQELHNATYFCQTEDVN